MIISFRHVITILILAISSQICLSQTIVSIDRHSRIANSNDSIWSFHPFSLTISPGIFIPVGKLSEYYGTCFQFNFSLGLKVAPKMRFELGLGPRFMSNKNKIEVRVNNIYYKTESPTSASLGGCFSYETFKNKNIFTELILGLTWEPLDTKLKNPNPKDQYDSIVNISTFGISLGTNIWSNIIGRNNLGVKILYTYAPYNIDYILVSNIGGHFISLSVSYRFPKREPENLRYYRDLRNNY